MSDKIYVGKGKKKTFSNGGSVLNISLRYDELEPNDRGYCNLVVAEMKNPDTYGNSHTVYVDDFVPKPKQKDEDPF